MSTPTRSAQYRGLGTDPLWYKDAIFYEVRVRSFYDSGGDGIGDFPGLTAKLDYLQRLGVTTLWLLPFYPSPLRDDGYDISDYMDVHPDCGTLHDFRAFLKEAHRRGLHVVTELVLNHTSDQHPWFQRARRASAGSPAREFYVWSDTSDRYRQARVIFSDFEISNWSWDPVAKAYYWHRFYAHQPNLNFDNPAVQEAIFEVVDFWLGMGVDGLRLDAVPYLYQREGTSCENLPAVHELLRKLRKHVDDKYANRMLLAEANQWPEDAVAYLDEGKECHMAFHFPLMPRMFMAVRMEDRFPITDVWAQTPEIHPACQWALFLRNHDELTLEMVTDEERDYMYRAYAQENRMRVNLGIRRRLAPLLGNNRRTIELNNALLFSLPGTPVIYYGDEIGMGDNVYLGDRDGVRTPMQWSGDRNAGFSTANPQRLILPVVIDYEYHYQTVNVEAQEQNRHSTLWWMRRLIALRRQYKAFGRGAIEFLHPENAHVLAFIRSYEDEQILVVANLSRFVQYAELDLSRFRGMVPTELFGQNQFPAVTEHPYFITLGPHVFLWFQIAPPRAGTGQAADLKPYERPRWRMTGSLEAMLDGRGRANLERAMTAYLPHARWFRGKARELKSTAIAASWPMGNGAGGACIALVNAEFAHGDPETYVMPLGIATGEKAADLRARFPERAIADVDLASRSGAQDGLIHDATLDPAFCNSMLEAIVRGRHIRAGDAKVSGTTTHAVRQILGAAFDGLEPRMLRAEQSNTSIVFGDRTIMKLFRRVEPGVNPELEMTRFLTERAHFSHSPQLAGWLQYQPHRAEPRTLAVLQGFIANQGDAWEFTRAELRRYFERAATRTELPPAPGRALIDLLDEEGPDPAANHAIGAYLGAARLIGQRVAEMHLALCADKDDPQFAPEPCTALYQRSSYQSMRNLQGQTMRLLHGRMAALPKEVRPLAQKLAAWQPEISACFEAYLKQHVSVVRIRTHGDLHLGQILHTGKDFAIIDFEGEPARALAERRRKRAALRDVAGMLRSFDYAVHSMLLELLAAGMLAERSPVAFEPWANLWETWASWAFLKGYVSHAGGSPLVPEDRGELRVLLDAFVIEKAIYELGYELNNRPDWVQIPLEGIARILGARRSDRRAAPAAATGVGNESES
jgi:maltose alpha-D-glucosyltransferase/alpha-amylase